MSLFPTVPETEPLPEGLTKPDLLRRALASARSAEVQARMALAAAEAAYHAAVTAREALERLEEP